MAYSSNRYLKLNFLWHYLKFLKKQSKRNSMDFPRFSAFNRIIKGNELSTYFQPIIELEKNEIIGYEGLNRPPSSVHFPTTESFYDYIGETNQAFFYEMHCRNLTLHKFYQEAKNRLHLKDRAIFINVHPQVLADSEYKTGETLQVLKELNISPSQIIFELTEKKAIKDYCMFANTLDNYRAQGFRIAIDDAGSGYNSLKSVVHLKPEFIKLDKSLIQGIALSDEKQKMASLLLDFSLQSNTAVIAEGIEETEDLLFLKKIGIQYGQGFLLGKPAKKLTEYI